jgi:hypothetical protein
MKTMRHILLLATILSGFSFSTMTSIARAQTQSDQAVITKKTVTLVRRLKDLDDERTASISYPLVTGIKDSLLLAKIRSALSFKHVLGKSLAEMRAEFAAEESYFQGLEEIDYTVNYNRRSILGITFTIQATGAYPYARAVHRLIDLKTGGVIEARHAFRRNRLRQLAAKVDQEMQQAIEAVKEESRENLERLKKSQDSKEYEEEVVYDEILRGVIEEGQWRFTTEALDTFMVDDRGVTFFYDFAIPHVILTMAPDDAYFFSWPEIKPYIDPAGALKVFLGGSEQAKKPGT